MADINNNNKTGLLYAKGKTNLIREREKEKKYFSRTGWENWKGGRLEKIVKKKKTFLKRGEKKKSQQSHIA